MSETRFIRRNGKIIPIREKKDGNVDKRHVSNKKLASEAGKLKPKKKNQAIGASAGAGVGAFAAYRSGKAKKAIMISSLVGAGLGLAAGSIRIVSKQEVANKMRKKSGSFKI